MEGVFSLPVAVRTDFIHSLVQSLDCSYICLWAYDSISSPNGLSFLDGFYNVRNNQQPSSSLGSSVAQGLFNQYQILTFDVNDDRVPGLSFRTQSPYLELQQLELLALASTEIQTQFYQEARIKTAVFMGCNKGEIELGFLNMSQVDIQTALRSLFPEDFSRQSTSTTTTQQQQIDQNTNPPSSSNSSSLISISTAGSPEYSSLIFSNINPAGTSQHHFPPESTTLGGGGAVVPPIMRPVSTTSPQQQQQQALQLQQALAHQVTPTPNQIFPTTSESEHDAIMRAILNVISSSSSPSPHQTQTHQNWPHHNYVVHPEASAFRRYINRPAAADRSPNITIGSNFRRQSLMKRSFAFFRNLNFMRMRDQRTQATRPSSTQLHHMISERRRREKLNENFQALRSLLPPGTKKDKASILITAKENLSSLMAEIDKLSKRNKELTLPANKESTTRDEEITINKASFLILSNNERFNVRVLHVPESSSSEEPMVDLQVNVMRGQNISQVDILIRLLEFLKQAHHVSLISMEATQGNDALHHQITFRLRITQGSEWDEDAFQEAVRRVVADLVQYQVDQNL